MMHRKLYKFKISLRKLFQQCFFSDLKRYLINFSQVYEIKVDYVNIKEIIMIKDELS